MRHVNLRRTGRSKRSLRGRSGRRRNRVQGTFDDLPDEEKTKALLQFLQYRQRAESEKTSSADGSSSTRRFEEMVGGVNTGTVGGSREEEEEKEDDDEREVEESLKIWYGLNGEQLSSSPAEAVLSVSERTRVIMFVAVITAVLSFRCGQ